jgi:hypothetical protein
MCLARSCAARRLPRVPQDLATHQCINARPPTTGGLNAQDFGKEARALKARVDGSSRSASCRWLCVQARCGFGIAFVLWRTWSGRTLTRGASFAILPTGVPRFPAIICTIREIRLATPVMTPLVEALRYGLLRVKGGRRPSKRWDDGTELR